MTRLRILGGLSLALAVVAAGTWWLAGRWAPARSSYAVQGIDVSDAQGDIDWAMVKARDVDFAYLRATAGADVRDPAFPLHWAGAGEAGIRRGAIHVFSLCARAGAQAGAFAATVPRDPDALPAAIDLDFHPDCPARPARDVVLTNLRQVAALIETHSGKPVVLRVAPDFEAAYRVSEAIPRSIWAVGDFFEPDYPTRPWRMWRSSSVRRVDGIGRPVNWNVVAP
jgi:lysozyme